MQFLSQFPAGQLPPPLMGPEATNVQWDIPPERTQQSRRIVPHPQHKQLSLVGKLLCPRHYSVHLWKVGTVGPILQMGKWDTWRPSDSSKVIWQSWVTDLSSLTWGWSFLISGQMSAEGSEIALRRKWFVGSREQITFLPFMSMWLCVKGQVGMLLEMKSVGGMALQAGEITAHTW